MPTWLVIVLLAGFVLFDLLVLGGILAVRRRRREEEPGFAAGVDGANRALAAAHAEDKGWEPGALREAARRAFLTAQPEAEIHDMQLVQVEDRPGIEEDRAVFRFETTGGGVHHLTLGRGDEGWVLEKLV